MSKMIIRPTNGTSTEVDLSGTYGIDIVADNSEGKASNFSLFVDNYGVLHIYTKNGIIGITPQAANHIYLKEE